jgi:hypothetical protein
MEEARGWFIVRNIPPRALIVPELNRALAYLSPEVTPQFPKVKRMNQVADGSITALPESCPTTPGEL